MLKIQKALEHLPKPLRIILGACLVIVGCLAFIITVVLTIALIILFLPVLVWYRRRKAYLILRSRLVLVCEVNGYVGIISRDAYQAAAQKYWEERLKGREHYDYGHVSAPYGHVLEVPGVVVLKAYSPEYYTLMYSLMCERAIFHVPCYEITPMNEAYKTLLGIKWDENLAHW